MGPFIAIGDPGERIPELGASRSYLPDDDWQETVKALMLKAKRILLLAGSGKSFDWELDQILTEGIDSKCLFLLPADGLEAHRENARRIMTALCPHFAEDESIRELLDFTVGIFRDCEQIVLICGEIDYFTQTRPFSNTFDEVQFSQVEHNTYMAAVHAWLSYDIGNTKDS